MKKVWPLAVSRYNTVRAAIRRLAPCDMAHECFDKHDRCATWSAAGAWVAIQILYRDREGAYDKRSMRG